MPTSFTNIISRRHTITSNAIACYSKGLGAKPKPSNISLIKCRKYVSLQLLLFNIVYLAIRLSSYDKNTSLHYLVSTGIQGLAYIKINLYPIQLVDEDTSAYKSLIKHLKWLSLLFNLSY